ncbi:MAG: hypothetical protein J6Y31_05420, partial [Bacteroidales bacterium]|nr:hypothetical protein [Bacteroidales bacterium]
IHPPPAAENYFSVRLLRKTNFHRLTSPRAGFAGDVCSVCLKEEQKTAKMFLLAFTLITERNKNGLFRSPP